jgi:hypothetical protein
MYNNDQDYLEEFQEILQSEVYVDLERLRVLAKHGVPEKVRGVRDLELCAKSCTKRL